MPSVLNQSPYFTPRDSFQTKLLYVFLQHVSSYIKLRLDILKFKIYNVKKD